MKVFVYNKPAAMPCGADLAEKYHMQALKEVGIEVTENFNDTYDLVDINAWWGPKGELKKILKHCKKNNIPVVAHAHTTSSDFRYSWRGWRIAYIWAKDMFNLVYKNVDHLIAVSYFTKHMLERDFIYSKVPISVIPNPLPLENFKPNKKAIKAFESQFNLKPTDKVVINAGLFIERKGVYDFIEVAKRNPDVKFFWFGDKKSFFLPLKLIKLQKKLPENMIMPGRMRNDIFFGALQRANCIFYPSFVETDGYVAVEAAASKTPLLIRDFGAKDDFIDGKHCFKGNTVDDFDKALKYILNNDMTDMANAAYSKAEERDMVVIGEQLKQLYTKLIEVHK